MKKLMSLLLIGVISLTVAGCGCNNKKDNTNNGGNNDYNTVLIEKAKEYYNTYVKDYVSYIAAQDVSVESMEKAGMDIGKLKNCSKDTQAKVELKVDADGVPTKEINKVTITKISCGA